MYTYLDKGKTIICPGEPGPLYSHPTSAAVLRYPYVYICAAAAALSAQDPYFDCQIEVLELRKKPLQLIIRIYIEF